MKRTSLRFLSLPLLLTLITSANAANSIGKSAFVIRPLLIQGSLLLLPLPVGGDVDPTAVPPAYTSIGLLPVDSDETVNPLAAACDDGPAQSVPIGEEPPPRP